MILGIDPGVGKRRCGFALVSEGKLFRHKTVDGCGAIAYAKALHAAYRLERCVIEKPRLGVIYARHLTKKNKVITETGRAKLAMNIGQNIYLAEELENTLKKLGVKMKMIPPKNKATKWDINFWIATFRWKKTPPSEHARDASIAAFLWENWDGWK